MNNLNAPFKHISVLSKKINDFISLNKGDIAIDCTAGGGGHTEVLLHKVEKEGFVLAFDQDTDAIKHLQQKFREQICSGQLKLEHSNFSKIKYFVTENKVRHKVKAIVADLGVSNHQINTTSRGFSFMSDGPLDMRMNTKEQTLTAKELVNTFSSEELADIFFIFGEERFSRRIAKDIVLFREKKEISNTKELANIIAKSLPYKHSKKHPATKCFQALRIYINKELEELQILIKDAFDCLCSNGFLAIITFHSLEDRVVKHEFRKLAGKHETHEIPRDFPLTESQINRYNNIKGQIIRPFPLTPDPEEISTNPQARSAKLRIIKKL